MPHRRTNLLRAGLGSYRWRTSDVPSLQPASSSSSNCPLSTTRGRLGIRDMTAAIKPIRRVVTGNDAQGCSRVLFDSAAPNVNPGAIVRGTCMTDVWVYQQSPAPISGKRDDGRLPFHFEPPAAGGHLRVVQSPAKPAGYDP